MALLVYTVGAAILLVLFLYSRYRNARGFWKKMGVEEIFPPNFLTVISKGNFSLAELDVLTYKQAKGKKIGGYFEFLVWNPAVYVTDLDLMKHVYIKDFDNFTDRRGFQVEKVDPHLYLTLINQREDDWKELRSKMSPTFTTGKIRGMFKIFDYSCKKLVKALNARAVEKDEIDLEEFNGKVTMDIIASAAFGIQTDMFEDPDSNFAKMGYKIQQQLSGKNLIKLIFIMTTPKLAAMLKLRITDPEADKFFSTVIKEGLNHRAKTGEKRDDFLQLMLEARQGVLKQDDENLLDEHEKSARLVNNIGTGESKIDFNDDLIIAQCLLFISGGFDTVQSLLVWAMYSLAVNPDMQKNLYNEVHQSFESNHGFTYDSISAMEYMDRVVKEVLRMYPPATRLERRSVKPYRIPGTNTVIPKDTLFQLPVYGLHHDPDIWPEPKKFDPDRFLKENVAKRHPCAYAPFGIGPRNCIGNRFALIECKLIISHLLLNFKFAPSKQTIIPPKFAMGATLKPARGMFLNVSPRAGVEE